MASAKKLLEGDWPDPVYSCDLYFHLDDDAFRAYERMTVTGRNVGTDYEYSFEYSDPVAEYPREVGERALKRLYEGIAKEKYGFDFIGPFVSAEGFAGNDWFVLKTVDDSMQDIQFNCIFRYNGSEWYEYGSGSDTMTRPLFGAYIVDENVGFLSYFPKFLDEPNGSYRKLYFYRTDDGGRTWIDMGLEIPDLFGYSYPGYAASPVFDGDHGVMTVNGGSEIIWWFETFDGGRTRESNNIETPIAQPTAEWFIENTRGLVERIAALYGLEFDYDRIGCSRHAYHADLNFPSKDGETELRISTGDCSDGELHLDSQFVYLWIRDQDNEYMEKWWKDFGGSLINVTPEDIAAAGVTPEDEEKYLDAVYAVYAQKLAEAYVSAEDGNPAKCREAHVLYAAPPMVDDPSTQTYVIQLAVIPEDITEFIKYRDFDHSICVGRGFEGPEHVGWVLISFETELHKIADNWYVGKILPEG